MLSHTMEAVLHTVFSFESVGSIHKGWFVLAIPVSCFRNTHFIVSASGRDCLDITGKQRVSFQHHQLSISFTSSPSSASPSPSPLPSPHSPGLGTDTLFIPLRKKNCLCHGPLGPHVLKFVIR